MFILALCDAFFHAHLHLRPDIFQTVQEKTRAVMWSGSRPSRSDFLYLPMNCFNGVSYHRIGLHPQNVRQYGSVSVKETITFAEELRVIVPPRNGRRRSLCF